MNNDPLRATGRPAGVIVAVRLLLGFSHRGPSKVAGLVSMHKIRCPICVEANDFKIVVPVSRYLDAGTVGTKVVPDQPTQVGLSFSAVP